MSLTIEAGKFYKLRCGWKARALEIFEDRHGDKMVIGYRINNGGYAWPMSWNLDGESRGKEADGYAARLGDYDIIAPWTDPPVVDWSKLPAHIVAVSMDANECWGAFTCKPVRRDFRWFIPDERKYDWKLFLRRCDIPIFGGDWRDSLVMRPGWKNGEDVGC